MGREAEPSRVRDSLSVADQEIGSQREARPGLEERRGLAEAQETGDVRKADRTGDLGRGDQIERGKPEDEDRREHAIVLRVVRDVGAGHQTHRRGRSADPQARAQRGLEADGSFRVARPGMAIGG